MTQAAAGPPPAPFLTRVFGVRRKETVAVLWSFAYFFCLLSSYYMLRSVRETMAIVSGVQNIPWLYTGTFSIMLVATPVFGWLVSRFPRRVFLPWVYYFFVANIALFYLAFTWSESSTANQAWVARAFFVWLSVFNLFVVAVFWAFMADLYTREQSRRLFGIISAGGSAGAFLGPLATSVLVVHIGFKNLLPLSALLLLVAVFCIHKLRGWAAERGSVNPATAPAVDSDRPLGGSALAGLKFTITSPYFGAIAAAMLTSHFLGVVIYIYMAQLVGDTFPDTNTQTQVFARLDAASNLLAFSGQALIVRYSVKRFGVRGTLMALPLVCVAGFALLALNPVFAVLAGLHVLRRSIAYGLAKPTNDMLYAVVTPEEKYKVKGFMDTAVWRGSDLIAAWSVRLLGSLAGLSGIALICLPVALAGAALANWIGRQYARKDNASPKPDPQAIAAT